MLGRGDKNGYWEIQRQFPPSEGMLMEWAQTSKSALAGPRKLDDSDTHKSELRSWRRHLNKDTGAF